MAVLTQYNRKPLVMPRKGIIMDSSLVLWTPLWHPSMSISPFTSKDPVGRSCTVTGATWGNQPYQQGYGFDGNDLISVPHAASLNLTALTIAGWIINTNLVATHSLLGKSGADAGDKADYKLFVLNTGVLNFGFRDAGGTFRQVYSTDTVAAALWYFIAVTFTNGGNADFYINGVPDSANPHALAFNMVDNTKPVLLGTYDDNGSLVAYHVGRIGDAFLYNRALTASEIQYNYLGTKWRYSG